MSDLYLMRHGQTLFNQLGRTQGFCDSPLTPLGIAQAEQAGKFLKELGVEFSQAHCSTSERAEDTLNLVYQGPYNRSKLLKEWNFGRFEGGPAYLEPPHKPGQVSHGDNFVPYGGEDVHEVMDRMTQALTEIMEQAEGNQLVVSHGGAMYAFYLNWRRQGDIRPEFTNCCILHYKYENHKFYLQESFDPTVESSK
ncbi:histidine phosphatase family protein [Ignavigranum ruoffiae]|uniref:histidine phosphatase family protein n=1 Tax=Ignavigranum ruoffiae TaxID=89093 RepID=UPI00206B0890|nr:histidine phosphatase family protein [Ignavigranum ruoffiae]UPQ85151.1 histidine phosphatase family protein [Ignavigranum ruoffiae]